MPLTPDQQAILDSLLAEQNKPEPRTETGLAGILHTVLDVASGAVAHLGADTWAELHHRVEELAGAAPAAEPAAAEPVDGGDQAAAAEQAPSSSSSPAKKTTGAKG